MKTSLLLVMLLSCQFIISCQKGDGPGPELRKQTEAKLMGKWNVASFSIEVYSPISTLYSTEVYDGTNEDYYVFQATKMVEIGAAPNAKTEVGYEVINPSQIWIGDQYWRITALTATELQLTQDRNVVEQNKRYVRQIYLRK